MVCAGTAVPRPSFCYGSNTPDHEKLIAAECNHRETQAAVKRLGQGFQNAEERPALAESGNNIAENYQSERALIGKEAVSNIANRIASARLHRLIRNSGLG